MTINANEPVATRLRNRQKTVHSGVVREQGAGASGTPETSSSYRPGQQLLLNTENLSSGGCSGNPLEEAVLDGRAELNKPTRAREEYTVSQWARVLALTEIPEDGERSLERWAADNAPRVREAAPPYGMVWEAVLLAAKGNAMRNRVKRFLRVPITHWEQIVDLLVSPFIENDRELQGVQAEMILGSRCTSVMNAHAEVIQLVTEFGYMAGRRGLPTETPERSMVNMLFQRILGRTALGWRKTLT
eukprot:Protomagalhaensia_sp_Gyna_25__2325@NODE_2280_length_1175_cov_6_806338_g1888_i0_p1_GENE_NODE_2280_length_1175_cov_6_806338_g1888_i0NODE_2280_length_1175_cov_6_806338_g1888_i0_p1_ORF_typecomplete_len245_score11_76_NODE_2280_length_1175_cov_6_806338_g1888_i03241058